MPIFPLTRHKTYFEKGFFNVTVDFDRYVRQTAGPVDLLLVAKGRQLRVAAKVDRTTNTNAPARIMGGATLRDWFLNNFDLNEQLDVDLGSVREIRIQKRPAS